MALPLDSLTLAHSDAGRDDTGSSLGASMPGFAPLAMPAQSFWRFSRRNRRPLAAPRLARPPILTRLAVFGGALALTAYGADQMFRVVSIGPITPLEWVIAVLFVITFSWITLSFTASIAGFVWLLAHRGPKAPAPAQGADRGRDADLQRGALARVRRHAGHLRGRRRRGPGACVRLLPHLRHHRPQYLDRGGARVPGDARAAAAGAPLLPQAAKERGPQGRQRRRFHHPLGRPLPAYGRARRRQRDDGGSDRRPGRGDGGRPRRGRHPEPAAHRQPQHDVRAPAAVRRPDRRPGHRRGLERVDGTRGQLLGP